MRALRHKVIYVITIFVATLLFVGCADDRLKFENKTGNTIYYLWSDDTINWINYNWYELLNDSTFAYSMPGRNAWEAEFKYDEDSTKHLFIFYKERVKKYEKDTIRGNIKDYYQYDERIDVKFEDLEKMNWIITIK